MMRRTGIKRKRETPRRDASRVQQQRMKPRAKAAPTAEEQAHIEAVAALGCLVCGQPAEVHHVMRCLGKVRRRDHRFVVPVCPAHHRGTEGVHGLGSEDAFACLYGIDLATWATEAWETKEYGR